MISVSLARRLRAAGLAWSPAPGDRFVVPDRDMDEEVFVLSTMVADVQELPHGQVIAFNGTVEWALDSLAKDDALWLPHEGRLRELLAGTFRSLLHDGTRWAVTTDVNGRAYTHSSPEAEEAYGLALLHLITGEDPGSAR